MYDWPVEEVLNTAEAHRRGAPIAPLAGFGYSKSPLGITQEYFIFTELLGEHINGMTWIESTLWEIETFIQLSFRLLRVLHNKQITHMDFWANNVMVNLAPKDIPMAIDTENCFPTTSQYFSETTAFQFGFSTSEIFIALLPKHDTTNWSLKNWRCIKPWTAKLLKAFTGLASTRELAARTAARYSGKANSSLASKAAPHYFEPRFAV